MRGRIYAIFFFIFFWGVSWGQDPHFSQFYASPLNLNPSYTGLFSGDVRASAIYRNQWQSIVNPFRTGSVAVDGRILRNLFKEDHVLGVGVTGLFDQSNNGGLRSRFLAVTAGYNHQLDGNGYHRLGVGFQASIVSKSIDYSRFVFSRQFTPNGFDNNLPTGEPNTYLNINYPDFGTGILYSGYSYAEHQWHLGASYYHITRPNESMTGADARLSTRKTLHAGYNFPVNELSRMFFSGLYMQSAITNEAMVGAVYQNSLNNYEMNASILMGLYYRFNESIIPYIGLEMNQFQAGLSYDITVSSLKTASNFRGGMELTIQYIFSRDPNRNTIPKCYNKF